MTKLYRSRRDSKFTGLCGGLAEQLHVDSTLLRLVVAVTTVFSAFTVLPIYIIASIVIPKEPLLNVPPMYPPYGGPMPGAGGNMYGQGGFAAPQQGGAYRPQPQYYGGPAPAPAPAPKPVESKIDEMMKDVEKKAMWKEIEELRAKVAKYEKGE
jgi:phage shock protein C